MGHDYAYAAPPLGLLRGWLWNHCIYPEVRLALDNFIQSQRNQLSNAEFLQKLATGISVYSYSREHTIYSVKIAPDTLCPDPRAQGRSPYFVMHLLMPGFPDVFSKRYDEFRKQCQSIAWQTLHSGVQQELKVMIPDDFYEKNM